MFSIAVQHDRGKSVRTITIVRIYRKWGDQFNRSDLVAVVVLAGKYDEGQAMRQFRRNPQLFRPVGVSKEDLAHYAKIA